MQRQQDPDSQGDAAHKGAKSFLVTEQTKKVRRKGGGEGHVYVWVQSLLAQRDGKITGDRVRGQGTPRGRVPDDRGACARGVRRPRIGRDLVRCRRG